MPTFEFLEKTIINALDNISKENLAAGGFCGSIMEFLGRIISYPKKESSGEYFKKFIEIYLKDRDARYEKYKNILWENFRNGGAHSVLPKSGIALSGRPINEEPNHLELLKSEKDDSIHLVLCVPKLIDDLKKSVLKFVDAARKNRILSEKYLEVVQKGIKEGQDFIKNEVKKNKWMTKKQDMHGDIKI